MEKGVVIDFNGLVRVVLKLSGLALAVYGAVTLAGYVPMILTGGARNSEPVQVLAILSGPAIFVAAGLFLWLFPTPVANTVVRADESGEDTQTWADRLVEAGCVLIGLWWLIAAMSDLVYHLLVKRAQDARPGYTEVYSEFGALMTATVVELVLALVLILGARGIAGLVRRLRYGGLANDLPD